MSDCVSREAVLNTLDTMDKALDENRTIEAYKELLKECYKELPPVTPERPKGRWVVDERMVFPKCSCCKVQGYNSFDFCPMCGADMREEKE